MGTVHVLEAAAQEGVGTVVFASSNAATGYWGKLEVPPDYLPLDEEHRCRPRDAYALSKHLNELTCRSYTEAHGVRTICLRISGGKYLDRLGASLIVPSPEWRADTVDELWDRFLPTVDEPARGQWVFWVYVDARDVASAFRLALENETVDHGTYFLSADDTMSRFESQRLLQRFFPDVPLKQEIGGYDALVSHQKATRELGWAPRHSWRECAYLASGGRPG
jgi:nucleoside-diphosphate-sugar epimerase